MSATWFPFVIGGATVGWQQLVRRVVVGPDGTPLVRREVLTAFATGGVRTVSAFFAELPEGEPLAWRRFGTLAEGDGAWVEDVAFVRDGDELCHPDGARTPLPAACYPGQLLLELALGLFRAGRAELLATPLHDGTGAPEPPACLCLAPALSGPQTATHVIEELPAAAALEGADRTSRDRELRADGPVSLARRAVLLAPDGRVERQVWGPDAWSGAATSRGLARAVGPADAPALATS